MVQANWRRDRRPRALPQAVSRAVVTPGVDGRPALPARVRFRGVCPWAASGRWPRGAAATAVSVGTALREGRCSRLVPQAFAPVPPPTLGPGASHAFALQYTFRTPVYTTSTRRNAMGVGLVFEADLFTTKHISHWVLQGVCLTLNSD